MDLTTIDTDPPVIAGDANDDDAQVFDTFDTPQPMGVLPEQSETVAPARELYRPRKTTRLLTGGQNIASTHNAVLLIPADPDRISLTLSTFTPDAPYTAATILRIADDSSKLGMGMGAYIVTAARDIDALHDYTGPVWVLVPRDPTGATDPVMFVSYAIVTR